MKKLFLTINLIIFSLIVLCSTSFAVESDKAFFQSHNRSLQRITGYFYVESSNGTISLEKVVRTNKKGNVEKNKTTEENSESLFYLKDGRNYKKKETNNYSQSFELGLFDNVKNNNNLYRKILPSDETRYNSLMWVLNNLINTNNKTERENLLKNAGLTSNVFKDVSVNGYSSEESEKDIIESIEQAAIYYFSNNEDYKPKRNANFYITKEINDQKINITEPFKQNQDAINKLYNYFINNAEENVKKGYTYNKNDDSPIVLRKDSVSVNTKENNNYIGPYIVEKKSNDSDFTFNVYGDGDEITNLKIVEEDQKTEIEGENVTSKISKTLGKKFYIVLPITSSVSKIRIKLNVKYNQKNITYYSASANELNNVKPVVSIKKQYKSYAQIDEKEISKPKFDLSIRTFIQTVNGKDVDKKRDVNILNKDLEDFAKDKSILNNGTTLVKNQIKTPVSVSNGDTVVYKIRVYNEGQIDGQAREIIDYIPEGLEFISPEESQINKENKWYAYNGNNKLIISDFLADKEIKAFDKNPEKGKYRIDYKDLQVELRVTGITQSTDTVIKNIVEIKSSTNNENQLDRDSTQLNISINQYKDYNPGTSENGLGYEDDDDYDSVVLNGKYFDLSLREFVSQVIEIDGNSLSYKREPNVNVESLLNGNTSADYKGTKGPVGIKIGDTIIYTIRIYNEGQVDGYADEITAHLPEELQYVNDEFNASNGWIIDKTDETQRTLKTMKLSKQDDEDNKIKAFDTEKKSIEYKDVQLKLKVKSSAQNMKEITLISEITKSSNDINLIDRDNKATLVLPSDAELQKYKGNTQNKEELSDVNYSYQGQEDDDDFEKVILQKFDLSLRTFVTAIDNNVINDRIPNVDLTTFETTQDGKAITTANYSNKKDILNVTKLQKIELTTRVYNEGTQDGYANEVKGTLEDGILFDKDNPINKKYGWKMLDENGNETEDVHKARFIITDYLSKEKDIENNKIKAFDKLQMDNIDYKELKAVLMIDEPKEEKREKNIQFQISKDSGINEEKVTDIDSVPNEWNENEDDQDQETIKIQFFDLKLEVKNEKVLIIEDGKEKQSNIKEKNKKEIAKISINKKQLENVVVKFKYEILITNEGEIPGYATQISNYVPYGLKFNQADNIDWKENGDKIITNKLKDVVIEPGKTEKIDLVLTWLNDESNMKVLKTTSEIQEVDNQSKSEDKKEENNIDSVEVMVVSTTKNNKIIIIIVISLLVIAGAGIFIIKKFIL